jgi:hypothetical protein
MSACVPYRPPAIRSNGCGPCGLRAVPPGVGSRPGSRRSQPWRMAAERPHPRLHSTLHRRAGRVPRWHLAPPVLDAANTASEVRADTAYRSRVNLALLEKRGSVAQFQRAKPRGKPMPSHVARGNATRAPRAQPGRARVRRREAAHGIGGAHHRAGTRNGEDHARKSGLQSSPARMDRRERCARLIRSAGKRTRDDDPDRTGSAATTTPRPPQTLSTRPAAAPFARYFEAVPLGLYAAALLSMIGCSALYNLTSNVAWKGVFRRLDHAAIFIVVAGAYSLFALLRFVAASGRSRSAE